MIERLVLFLFSLIFLVGCAGEQAAQPETLRLMTHDSFDISAETMQLFTDQSGIEVEIFKAGDAGAMVNQAVLAKDNPLADVIYGIDNTFLSRALENDILLSHDSPQLAQIDDALKLDAQNRALPVDFGDVCLNYDRAWFADNGLEPPHDLADLVEPEYAGLTVVENPATSSPGLAFLLATIDTFGESGYLDFWSSLVENDVLVTDGWEEAYYGSFSAASDGQRPIVVSYASSPPVEVYFAEQPPAEAPTAAVVGDGACFRQIEFVGILKGSPYEEAAGQLVDFMLGQTFQEDIPLHMFVFPANETAVLPEVFLQHSVIPSNPATMDPQAIASGREEWVRDWTETVLR